MAVATTWSHLGNTVILDHGGGAYSVYSFLGTLGVAEGATVGRGTPIGTIGFSGDAAAMRIGPFSRTHPDLAKLMDAYRAENAATAVRQDSTSRARLGRIEVRGPASDRTLTVDLQDAPLDRVLRQILHDVGRQFVYEGVSPAGPTVDIGRTRYYLSQTFQQGVLTPGGQAVSTGVVLHVTPTALPGDRVRVDLHVEESQFIPTVDNAASETDKSVAETSMQVPSGQTIVIGGLALDRQTNGNAGIPILRDIPILNLLTSRRNQTSRTQEVVIFITPHIWNPSLEAPLAKPNAFEPSKESGRIRP